MGSQVVVTGRFERLARIIGAQVGVSLAIAALLLAARGRVSAGSAVIGGGAAFIPAVLYASRMLAVNGTDPNRLLAAQYRAEAFKILGTVIILGAAFRWFRGMDVLALFGTYFAALLVYWAALLFDR